jgi:hypothetical protein
MQRQVQQLAQGQAPVQLTPSLKLWLKQPRQLQAPELVEPQQAL